MQDVLMGVIAGGIVTLNGKILWDWLSKGRKNGNGKMVETLSQMCSALVIIRDDTKTTRDDVKSIKQNVEIQGEELSSMIKKSIESNTKMITLLELLNSAMKI